MYSWGDDMEDWAKPGAYRFDAKTTEARKKDAERSEKEGPRTYHRKGKGPNQQLTDPKKRVSTTSKTPLIVGVGAGGGWCCRVLSAARHSRWHVCEHPSPV